MNLPLTRICLFVFLVVCCLQAIAQQKDSTKLVKSATSGEEINPLRKKRYTFFASDRSGDDTKFDIYRVIPTTQAPSVVIVRGHMEVMDNPNQKKAKISVYNASNNELVGIFSTNPFTANYLLVLVPNVKYNFKVEASGYGILEETVEVPLKIDYEVCVQELKIRLNDQKKPVIRIHSFFSDEHEKVSYLRSVFDTAAAAVPVVAEAVTEPAKTTKPAKAAANIDELVKKQVAEEKKKPLEALKAFHSKDYEKAFAMYSLLLKNDPLDPFMNYYYGVSAFLANKNKAKAIQALQLASGFKQVPYDVFLHLGKACHVSYLFQNAITALEEYKKRAKPAELATNNIALLLKNCKSGIELLSEQVSMDIVKRTDVNGQDLLAAYDPETVNDRVREKTMFFNSPIDKQKQEKLLMCKAGGEFYHASYGTNTQSGLNIYRNMFTPMGTMGASQDLGAEINTPLDENYPFISNDGRTMYFSSKGHNSMGGYDIFVCTRQDSLSPWSKPKNMGYPVNSTYDDILFVHDTTSQFASFCSNRKNNKFEFIQIKMPNKANESVVIKGSFATSDSVPKHEAMISVYNSNTGEVAGVYKTNPETGHYIMILASGTKYDMSVESSGYLELSTTFELPEKNGEFILKQTIAFRKDSGDKALLVKNYFTESDAARITIEKPVKHSAVAAKTKKEPEIKAQLKKPARTPEESKKDQEDLLQAKNLYSRAVYQEAALLYRELEKYIDLDADNAYLFAMSLFHIHKEKSECIRLLEIAVSKNPRPEMYYQLARAHHLSYHFTTAVEHYKKYASLVKPEEAQHLNIAREIECCSNGLDLVNSPVVMEVYEKKHVELVAIQNSLTQLESGAKVLVITDDMRSSIDKSRNFRSLLYLTPDKNTVLYASYGEDETKGKDIYMLKRTGNGKWSPVPQNISVINSVYDEEFPSLSKDGKTLYFSSKGWNSMGGYDIFKSEWDEEAEKWLPPENMGSPVNSPYEDIYYLE